MRSKRTERRATADKYAITVGLRPPLLEIGDECISNLLAEGQARLSTAFPRYEDPPTLPVNVVKTQLHDIAGS